MTKLFRRVARKLGILSNHGLKNTLLKRDGYVTIFDDDSMTVLHKPGRGKQCVVSFTGVGHGLGRVDLQNPEFTRSDSDESKVFVIDKQRSWGNNLDWDKLKSLLEPLTRDAQITTLGNSMGGFLAILSASKLGAAHAIAFAPQWSVDPRIVPDEERWLDYRDQITHFRYPDLSKAFQSPTKYFVFFGKSRRDAVHLKFFRLAENKPDIFVFMGAGHNVAAFLKENGQLYPAIDACRTGDDVKGLLKEANLRFFTK